MTAWPPLPLSGWRDTYETLHHWSQIPGKILLARTPLVNHFWNVAFRVTPRGMTTGSMRFPEVQGRGRSVQFDFDFIDHALGISTNEGDSRSVPFRPTSVADFYRQVMGALDALGIRVHVWTMPVEIENPIRFEEDRVHAAYDREAVARFHRALLAIDPVLQKFRAGYLGKTSPVHFFWGSFDLCVTRFSGRKAPDKPDADAMTREAYSHEVSSVGWWPGGKALGVNIDEPTFYAYAAPEPERFAGARVRPAAAYYHPELKEFLLPYDAVRTAADPEADLLAFCESTYDAAADLGKWDRSALERSRS